MAKSTTIERPDTEAAAQNREMSETKDFNALQDWMCSIGEPMSSIIVSIAVSIVIIIAAFILDALWWHTL